ncbi:MAG: hypothetical protein OEY56_09185 [Cyclobacteriaceae bacterium]|nr:hypothetical protein [Cyclobacteriaceae bacterium]
MFKKPILRLLTNLRFRKKKTGGPVGYAEAKTFGVLVNLNQKEPVRLADFLLSLQHDHKDTHVIGICHDKKKFPKSTHPIVGRKDISTFGSIKAASLQSFLDRKFDFLLVLDQEDDCVVRFLTASCEANYRVGFFSSHDNSLLDMALIPKNEHELDDILKYTKRIK